MRIVRSLATRIILAALFSGLVGAIGAIVVVQILGRDFTRSLLDRLGERVNRNMSLEACERDPSRWVHVEPDGIRAFAHDAASGRSANDAAVALDASLVARMKKGAARPAIMYHRGAWGGALLMRGRPSGPCSLIQVSWPEELSSRLRSHHIAIVAGAVGLCTILELLAAIFVFRPLLRRLGRLERAAGAVGTSGGFVSDDDRARDELGGLARSLRGAHDRIRADTERLERARQATERFLGDVAHDLRTPIASLQIALEELADLVPSKDGQALVGSALSDAVYLGSLVANLRLATRLREGWDPLVGDPRADLAEVVERVTTRERVFARRKGIVLESAFPDGPLATLCDATMAEQAITNLVQNAITYNEPGGHVSVVLERAGDRFALSVRDDGPGVPPEELPRLGERTFRSDLARQRDPRGSGLGLAIVAEVVARCGWKCTFSAAEPRGLLVSIDGAVQG